MSEKIKKHLWINLGLLLLLVPGTLAMLYVYKEIYPKLINNWWYDWLYGWTGFFCFIYCMIAALYAIMAAAVTDATEKKESVVSNGSIKRHHKCFYDERVNCGRDQSCPNCSIFVEYSTGKTKKDKGELNEK